MESPIGLVDEVEDLLSSMHELLQTVALMLLVETVNFKSLADFSLDHSLKHSIILRW